MNRTPRRTSPVGRRSDRGVVLLFVLIALLILMIGAVALVRSFNGSLFMSGNLAFKRDLQNQGERAVDRVLTHFRPSGGLATPAARAASSPAHHYSPTALPTNAMGIPTALTSASEYATVTNNGSQDINKDTDTSIAGQAVAIQYVVDRLCTATGDENALGSSSCILANTPIPSGTSSSNLQSADRGPLCATCASAAPQGVVYRVTVKLQGPRGTHSFFQSTFTMPSPS